MQAKFWIIPTLLVAAFVIGSFFDNAAADSAVARFEYKHLLIPLDRHLHSYAKSDQELLGPIHRLGREGWELVSAYEPAGGFTIKGRASVEFWFKRRIP